MQHRSDPIEPEALNVAAAELGRLSQMIGRVVLGQDRIVRSVLVALVAGGHVLLEGPPGIGKTLLARALAQSSGLHFRRVQFTPDLMPSDVTGSNVFDPRTREFEFRAGPIFTQLLLADEINRAPAKTQASLLEAMSDRQVTVDGNTRSLPRPFFVIATQNPIESEGTYPLPEAQLDRFLMKLVLEHPPEAVEVSLLASYLSGFDASDLTSSRLEPVCDGARLEALRQLARRVTVAPALLEYIVRLVGSTRRHSAVALGASPRAAVALLLCAQASALMDGRSYVIPDDVKELVAPVLRHRFLLEPDAELEGVEPEAIVSEIVKAVPVPERAG